MSIPRLYAIAFGVVYTLVGLLGFVATDSHGLLLGLFPVNTLHNLVHLLFGLAGIAAFMTGRSVLYAQVGAVLFAILAVAGFFPQPFLGLVPLGGLDIGLHALTAILGALAGWVFANRGETARV